LIKNKLFDCKLQISIYFNQFQDVYFFNNFVSRNLGGLYIRAGSSGTATAMKGILHNNVFEENVKKITLHLEGRTSSPYQQITMYQNYITRSDVDHEPVILFYQVKTYSLMKIFWLASQEKFFQQYTLE